MTDTPADMSGTEAMRVLFLCTRNSSRSQMAEGLLRARGGKHYMVFSAGTHPRAVHPLAVKAIAELGIDISEAAGHRAKGIGASPTQVRLPALKRSDWLFSGGYAMP